MKKYILLPGVAMTAHLVFCNVITLCVMMGVIVFTGLLYAAKEERN